MLYTVLVALIFAVIILMLVVRLQNRRLNLLKETYIQVRAKYDKDFEAIFKRINMAEVKVGLIDREVFIMVEGDSINNFQEKVSISTILGGFMAAMGYKVESKRLKITKEKGENCEEIKRKETKRSQSKEKES